MEIDTQYLKQAIESQHGCKATFAHEMPIMETWQGKTVWDWVVSVFDLTGHPLAKRAYAWSEPNDGSNKRRFFAVLHVPPVDSALMAVKASIVDRQRQKNYHHHSQLSTPNREAVQSLAEYLEKTMGIGLQNQCAVATPIRISHCQIRTLPAIAKPRQTA
jgi:hypothetical protein